MTSRDTNRAPHRSKPPLRRLVAFYSTGQFGRFLLVGGVALVCHWLSRFAFNAFVSYAWAIVLAYLVGILVAFTLNKIYVFPYSQRSLNFEMLFFFLVNIAAFPLVWAIVPTCSASACLPASFHDRPRLRSRTVSRLRFRYS